MRQLICLEASTSMRFEVFVKICVESISVELSTCSVRCFKVAQQMWFADVLSLTDFADAFALVLFVVFFLVFSKNRSSLELFT